MIGTNLTVSEAMGIHEILLETATMVDKLAFYVDETEHPEIESIFSAHLRAFERTYSELLGFAQHSGAHTQGGVTYQGRGTVGGGQKPSRQTVRPQPSGRMSDRTMVMDCLVACKEMAVGSVKVATECSSTTLRRTLADVSRNHLEMAHELYKIAEQHGWYPSLKPQDSPEEWLRSTHLPVSVSGGNAETSHIGAAYGNAFVGAAEPSRTAYGGGLHAHTPENYGTAGATRTADGANWGATGRHYGTSPEGTPPYQYGEPVTDVPHRR